MEYGKKPEKYGKREMLSVGPRIRRETMKILENGKHQLDDLKNDEITKKREK